VLGHRLVIVSDAHLGARTAELEAAFIEFLEAVPTLGDSLLINGDLFEFWFEYRRVVPRTGFHVLAALAALRKKIPIVAMGGNHDRWGESFWWKDLRIDFHVKPVRLAVGRRAVLAVHGDGITENHWSAVLLHRITSHPMTIGLFRSIHPDLGFWIADRLSNGLGYSERDPAVMDRAAQRQREWAEARLAEDPTLGLVVMGHTHRPALSEPSPGRQYLNPGAWLDGYRFAVATESGAELRRFRQD
jgi:UDP-2,3-diacylglucosamine hydrolase